MTQIPDRVLVLLNPTAGSGRMGRGMGDIRRLIDRTFADPVIVESGSSGDIALAAKERAAEFELVVVAGGDGTINEAVAGLQDTYFATGSHTALGIIPFGTGNDFARALRLPENDPEAALSALVHGETVSVDTGLVAWTEGETSHSHVFVNAVGIGFDAHTAHAVHLRPSYKALPRSIGYTTAVLVSLLSWRSPEVRIEALDTVGDPFFEGRMMFTTVGNAMDSGGGFRINPHARLRDGLLDACIVREVSIPRALVMLPRARSGAHVLLEEVQYVQLKGLRILCDQGLPIHCDGEVPSASAMEIEVRVREASLDVRIPLDAVDLI